jgi:hypothetical protein
MNRPKPAGTRGEEVAEWVLVREGWKITARQIVAAGGHRCDFAALHPDTGEEWLVEVKVWGPEPSGHDTVKKAIADAYDLAQAGEARPFMLIVSHRLTGLLGGMVTRARRAGVLNDVRLIKATDHGDGAP